MTACKATPWRLLSFLVVLLFLHHSTIPTGPDHQNEVPGINYVKNGVQSKVVVIPQSGSDSTGAPPWEIPTYTVVDDADVFLEENTEEKFIYGNISFAPGLGNIMFQYAALRAIALQHNATLIIREGSPITRAFKLDDSTVVVNHDVAAVLYETFTSVSYSHCCRFYADVAELNITKTTFRAYFQSFKYFEPEFADVIQEEFTFLPPIIEAAEEILDTVVKAIGTTPILVGMHVRRGIDMTWNLRNIEHGHVAANWRYYHAAMSHFVEKFGNVTFVVSSDDRQWLPRLLKDHDEGEQFSVQYVNSGSREVDMCTLTLCQHTIMSQGTFSWWIAYLTGGHTTYFSKWPRRESTIDRMLNRTEYFMSDWVPLE